MIGPKPPLRPGHDWAIRAKLHLQKRTRDLAMFNLAIDSKLRGCDLMALCVDDVAPNSYARPSLSPDREPACGATRSRSQKLRINPAERVVSDACPDLRPPQGDL